MLDREVVKEFVLERLKETDVPIPKHIKKKELIEAFCLFTEYDYYEWLKDNYKTFFNHGDPNWGWIEDYLKKHILNKQ